MSSDFRLFSNQPDNPISRACEFLSEQLNIQLTLAEAEEFQSSENGASDLDEYTDRTELLKLHAGTLWALEQVLADGSAKPITQYFFKPPKDTSWVRGLKPQKRMNIAGLLKSVDKQFKGKFFLCRSIAVPVIHEATFQTVVDEPFDPTKDVKAVPLMCTLQSNPLGTTPETFLPIGTFIIIKNPMIQLIIGGGYRIRCLNQNNYLMIRHDQLEKVFQGLKWEIEIQSDTSEHSKLVVATEMKTLGNLAFSRKKFVDAIESYSQGLSLDPKSLDLLSNRAACYLNMRCYIRALADVEKVLDIEPFHFKAIFRKVKAQWGLQQYKAARAFLIEKFSANSELKKSENLSALLEIAEKVERQSETGKNYEMEQYLSKDMISHDVGEYTRSVKLSKKDQKGQQFVIATEDIEPGQLLICMKAFSIHFTGPDADAKMFNDNVGIVMNLAKLTFYKLQAEREHIEKGQFYNMPADVQIKPLSSGDTEMDYTYSIVVSNCVKYIGSTIALAGTVQSDIDGMTRMINSGSSLGLWTLPSHIKEGCFDSNSTKLIVGDLVFIRAIKNIRKGEAITIARQSPLIGYLDKRDVFEKRGYSCPCRLCTLDSQDSNDVHEIREKLSKSMNMRFFKSIKTVGSTGEHEDTECLVKWIATLRELRPMNPELNINIITPIHYLAEIFYNNKEFNHSVTLWKEAYGLAKNAGLGRHMIAFAASIVDCNIFLDRNQEIFTWLETLKKDLIIYYGTMEVLKYYEKEILDNIACSGIRFL